MLEVKKLDPAFLISFLKNFSLFSKFLNSNNFWNLDYFFDFLINFLLLSPILNLTILLLFSFFFKANISNNLVVFGIKINKVIIWLKP